MTDRVSAGTGLKYRPYRNRVPLLVGTWGPKTLAWAGARVDAVKLGGSASPDLVTWAAEHIRRGATRANRDPDEVAIVIGAVSVIDEDGERARRKARTEVAMYLDVVADLDPTSSVDPAITEHVRSGLAAGNDDLAGLQIPDELLDRFSLSGTPERVAAQIESLYEAGATRVELGTPQGLESTLEGVRLITERVIPRLT